MGQLDRRGRRGRRRGDHRYVERREREMGDVERERDRERWCEIERKR
jgi:hypothetical protein